MTVLLDSILALLLIMLGYISVCYYLHSIKFNSINVEVLKLNKRKALYLVSGVAISILLIIIFQVVYKQELLCQMKLITLTLAILPMACVDYKIQKIPNVFIIAAFVLWTAFMICEFVLFTATAVNTLKSSILGSVVIGVFFLLLLLIFKNSIGMGDVKLFAIMGLYQGLWGAINSVFFSLLVSFVLSVFLLITKRKGRKDTISFGPSILLGTVIAISLSGM